MRSENAFKIATIILTIVLVLVLGFIAFDKYTAYQNNKIGAAYSQGAADVIAQVFQRTADCGVVPLTFGNGTRSVADVACIQQAIQQGLGQAQTANSNQSK